MAYYNVRGKKNQGSRSQGSGRNWIRDKADEGLDQDS